MLEAFAIIILAVGALGYLVCLPILWRFRVWTGKRGRGLVQSVLATLIFLTALLAFLYLDSLVRTLAQLPRAARLWVSFAEGIALALAPWGLVVAVARWWLASPPGAERRGGPGWRPRWWRRRQDKAGIP